MSDERPTLTGTAFDWFLKYSEDGPGGEARARIICQDAGDPPPSEAEGWVRVEPMTPQEQALAMGRLIAAWLPAAVEAFARSDRAGLDHEKALRTALGRVAQVIARGATRTAREVARMPQARARKKG
jgi:hypothetical protein